MLTAEPIQNEVEINWDEIDWEFHDKQLEALDTIESPVCEVLDYGGAKGGGKSVLGCRYCVMYAQDVIEQFDIQPTRTPLAIGFIGRKQGTDLMTTTLKTWLQFIDPRIYRINEHKKQIIIRERVALDYGGLDKQKALNKFNSAEYGLVFIDQAEEISEDEFGKLRSTLRLQINEVPLKFKMFLSCNPAPCWMKHRIIKNAHREDEGIFFIQALPADNPFLPDDYIPRLEKSFRHRLELLSAYLHGCWDELEGSDLIIKDVWVQRSHTIELITPVKRRLVVCDPARFGDDRTVIYYLEETKIVDSEVYGQKDAHYTSGKIAAMANKHKIDDQTPVIVIDADGLGGPIGDNLVAWGFDVIFVDSAGQATEPTVYCNKRAQMWWEVGVMFSDGDVANHFEDTELDTELTVPKYRFLNGKILVEKKEEIKKPERYGKSPDKGDAYVMGLWHLPYGTEKKKAKTGHKDGIWDQQQKTGSYMAV